MTTEAIGGEVLVPPAFRSVPAHAVASTGDLVADMATKLGHEPDPEQRLAIDGMCAVDREHRWAAFESCIIEGRQNGKTEGVILPVVLDDLFYGVPDRIVWTAHRFRVSRAAFMVIKNAIDGSAELSARTKKINESHGEESVELHHPQRRRTGQGALLEFLARSRGVGRGLGGKLIVFDEALYLEAAAMGALIPTLSARQNTRILYASSAGVGISDHLRSLRDRGRRGGDPSLSYIEWGTPEGGCEFGDDCPHYYGTQGCKLDDESLWPLGNHAMARNRITYEAIRNERRSLPPGEFARERMGWWDAPAEGDYPIDKDDWERLAVKRARKQPPGTTVPVFFVHVAPDQTASAIGVAYNVRGKPYVGLVDYKPGTVWLVRRGEKLIDKYPDSVWAVEDAGAVGSELPALAEVGIEPERFSSRDMGQACGHLQQLVNDAGFTHSGNPAFTMSVQGSGRRPIGEGLWVFSPRVSAVDTTPLTTAAGALWTLEKYPPVPSDIF